MRLQMSKRKRPEQKGDEQAAEPPAKLPKETEDMISQLIDLTGLPEELWATVIRDYTDREPMYRIIRENWGLACLDEQWPRRRYRVMSVLSRLISAVCTSPKKTLVDGYWWCNPSDIQSAMSIVRLSDSETQTVLDELEREGWVTKLVRFAF